MSFTLSYIYWHYSKAFAGIWRIFSNLFWVTYRFFSISLLLKTFFAPWRRLDNSYGKKLDFQEFFGTLIVNTLMRLVGMSIRLLVILAGMVSLAFIFLAEIAFVICWITLPLIIFWLIYTGILKMI